MSLRPSAIVLVLVNLLPLGGVLALDWQVFDVLLLYWSENVVIGVVNVLRMAMCQPGIGLGRLAMAAQGMTDTQRATLSQFGAAIRWFLIPFFILHYGMFCSGHLMAVVSLFGGDVATASVQSLFFGMPLHEMWLSPLWIGIAAIAVSHLYSFAANYIGTGEYRRTNLMQLMQRPYGRIIALHITVIAGGALVTWLNGPLWALVVLIAIKTAYDLRQHSSERRLFAEATGTPSISS